MEARNERAGMSCAGQGGAHVWRGKHPWALDLKSFNVGLGSPAALGSLHPTPMLSWIITEPQK